MTEFWAIAHFLFRGVMAVQDNQAAHVAGFNMRRTFFMNLFWVVLISLFTLLVYRHIYRADFFLDDYLHLHLVSRITNPLTPYFTDLFMGAFFRPGVFLFWKINHVLFDLNATGYYATNIAFLLTLVGLVYFVIHNMTGNRRFTTWAVVLFAVNPVTSIGVLWLSNRFDLIGSVFYMLSLLLFLRFVRTRNKRAYIWAVIVGTFSYFCKEMMVTLPVAMIICASFMFMYRATLTKQQFREIVTLSTPFFTLGVLFILWRYGVIHSMGGYSGETKIQISAAYIYQLYGNFADYMWIMKSKVFFSVYMLILGLLLVKADAFKNNPLSLVGLALAVVTSLPLAMVFNIPSVMTYMTPRFFFLPGLGMTILLASVYDPRSGKVRKVLASIFLGATVLFFALNTFLSTHKWAEERRADVKIMNEVHTYLSEKGEQVPFGEVYYVLIYGSDVAMDAGMKIRFPEYLDKCYFISPAGPTQVIGTEYLYQKQGKTLEWPKTFNKNPCNYQNLVYGVVFTQPRDIVDRIAKSESVSLLTKDRYGQLVTADNQGVRGLLSTLGVLFYD